MTRTDKYLSEGKRVFCFSDHPPKLKLQQLDAARNQTCYVDFLHEVKVVTKKSNSEQINLCNGLERCTINKLLIMTSLMAGAHTLWTLSGEGGGGATDGVHDNMWSIG